MGRDFYYSLALVLFAFAVVSMIHPRSVGFAFSRNASENSHDQHFFFISLSHYQDG